MAFEKWKLAAANRSFRQGCLAPPAAQNRMSPARRVQISDMIGKQLREIYSSVPQEPLPDQFSELLNGFNFAR